MSAEQKIIIFNNGESSSLCPSLLLFYLVAFVLYLFLCAIHYTTEAGCQKSASHRLFFLSSRELKGSRDCKNAREIIDTQFRLPGTETLTTLRGGKCKSL